MAQLIALTDLDMVAKGSSPGRRQDTLLILSTHFTNHGLKWIPGTKDELVM